MSAFLDRPRLRPGLSAGPTSRDPSLFMLWDSNRITHRIALLRRHEIDWAQMFDGRNTVADVHGKTQSNGQITTVDDIVRLAERLESALLLDSAQFYAYLDGPIREPSCLGSYHADPNRLREQVATLFTAPGGPGLPTGKPPARDGSLRALLAPHMDYGRGGAVYGWGFRELFDNTSARLFVIIGTSHYSRARFTISRQKFMTPLGVAETDHEYVDRIVDVYGPDAFSDPFAHLPEHSIELEVVLLQFLYEHHRPFRIVPILVGSFGDAVEDNQSPRTRDDITRMVAALRRAESAAGEEVCYIISGDLAHIGPKFGDEAPVTTSQLESSKSQDLKIIEAATAANGDEYFQHIAAERDERRICGLPPTWTTLAATKPTRGRLLKYEQFIHPTGFESVSFASMAFDR